MSEIKIQLVYYFITEWSSSTVKITIEETVKYILDLIIHFNHSSNK